MNRNKRIMRSLNKKKPYIYFNTRWFAHSEVFVNREHTFKAREFVKKLNHDKGV